MQGISIFEGRKMVLSSMHQKELAMKAIIEEFLKVEIIIPKNIDTDIYGTFSGEVERKYSPIETLKIKINKGLELTNTQLGIGNEGSFVPHPSFPWVNADIETVMLIDQENDVCIEATDITTETNFDKKNISKWTELQDFANKTFFPSHALILKLENKAGKVLETLKGIHDWKMLEETYFQFSKKQGLCVVETDMRAMYNPMRMKFITEVTKKLVKKVCSLCPSCGWIGFDSTEVIEGLPCEWCSQPTSLPLKEIKKCIKCQFEEEKWFPKGIMFSEPMNCNYCNP
jgi:hypothetical protein